MQEQQALEGLKRSIDLLDARLARIEASLIGEPELGNLGFTRRIETLEQKHSATEEKVNKMWWVAMGAGGAVAFIVQIIMQLIKA